MIEDVDKIARDLPRVCLHGHIPTATTMALAARVVELLDRVDTLEADNDALRQIIGECYRAAGVENVGTLDETPGLVLAVMSGLKARAADHSKSADDALGRVAELEEIIEANVPLPWCPECKIECSRVDEDGCCLGCGVDAISPTSHHVARVGELEKAASELTSFWTGLGGGRVAVLSAAFDELRRVADQRGEVKSDG